MENKNIFGKNAFELFPDLVRKKPHGKTRRLPSPPPPPDISWIYQGGQGGDRIKSEDTPSSLVLIPNKKARTLVEKILAENGFRVETASSAAEALPKLQAFDYPLLVATLNADGKKIHEWVSRMPPARRRTLYYVLVGPDLHTMYDLEALSLSVNMVVNSRDVMFLWTLLRKGFQEYENLFGPLIEAVRLNKSFV